MKKFIRLLVLIILWMSLTPGGGGQPVHRALAQGDTPQPTIIVNTTLDDPRGCPERCTLRSAIATASPGAVIGFDPGVSGVLMLAQTLVIDRDLTIVGPGAEVFALDGGGRLRVLEIQVGVTVSISGLIVQNGADSGIYNQGALTVTNSAFSGNSADWDGGGIRNEGALTVTGSTFSGNSAGHGGGIRNRGELTVTNSTFSGNSAGYAGGIANGGELTVTKSTFSGNSASEGGGIYNAGALELGNGIVAGNTAEEGPDIFGTVNSLSFNLIGNPQGAVGFWASDLQNVDPLLGPLADNGGPTQTMALLEGSPAIDAIPAEYCVWDDDGNPATPPVPLTTDQRGAPRSGPCDIGAFEFGTVLPG